MRVRGFTAALLLGLLGHTAVAEPDPASLAQKAQQVLQANCYRCHGQEGANEGGFSYVLDRQRLLASHKVVPGQPDASRLLKRVRKGDMPPEEEKPRPSDADVAALAQWIEAGAPDFNPARPVRQFLSQQDVLTFIQRDLAQRSERDRRFSRYFTLTHLYNAGWSEDELESYRLALSKLVNSLSWGRHVVRPTAIDPAGTILRLDLRDYKWNEKVWETIVASYPYGVLPEGPVTKECCDAAACALPHVRGDWFVAAASRPPLYHDVLQLPASDRELEKMLQVDVDEDIRQERLIRAGFNGSGVSNNNRLIERHEACFGAYWKSYDFASSAGLKNLFEHPLGPTGASGFQHDGGEIIFNLPNGLQGYMLVNGKGERIDRGPTAIVSDPKQPERAVVNGISCMSCHNQGMIEKGDQVRESVLRNANAFEKKEADTILALYRPKTDLEHFFQEDHERFVRAVAQTGGRVDQAGKVVGSDPVVNLALLFERDLDQNLAAAEVGVPPEKLLQTLDGSPRLARALGPLKVEGGTVHRAEFVLVFRDLVGELKIGLTISLSTGGQPETPATTPAPRPEVKPVADQVLAQLLNDLKSSSMWTRKAACERLAGLQATAERPQVAVALEPLVNDTDTFTRQAAIKALGVWGTKENVPALLKLLKGNDIWSRKAAILALGELKDERAAGPLAECLKDFGSRAEATRALQAMGPVAEKDVAEYLKKDDVWLKVAACGILKVIGTPESVPALEAVVAAQDVHTRFHVAPAAQEALTEIKARQQRK